MKKCKKGDMCQLRKYKANSAGERTYTKVGSYSCFSCLHNCNFGLNSDTILCKGESSCATIR